MIYFDDITLNESRGNFHTVNSIMRDEDGVFEWMLKSKATVAATDLLGRPGMTANYVLHFWHDGKVYIMETDRPFNVEVPDDDIRELHKWCLDNGWPKLYVHKRLIADQQGFDFWKRMFISGLVQSDELAQHEDEEITRLSNMQSLEEIDDADQGEIYIQET